MDEFELQQHLQDLLDQAAGADPDDASVDLPRELCDLRRVVTFRDAGLLTSNAGLILRTADGSEYQLTIVRSKGAIEEAIHEQEEA